MCVCITVNLQLLCLLYIVAQNVKNNNNKTTANLLRYLHVVDCLKWNRRYLLSIFRCTKCCLCNHSHIHRNEFYSRIPWRQWVYFPVFSLWVLVKHTHWVCLQALLQILWNSSHLNSLDTLEFRLPCLTSVSCPSSAYAEPRWEGYPWINQRIGKLNW